MKINNNEFYSVRLIDRDIRRDWVRKVKQTLGKEVENFEEKTENCIISMLKEIKTKNEIKKYTISITDMYDAILVVIYGEYENKHIKEFNPLENK